MINFKEIGARIKRLRQENHMTQEKFAEILDISTEHLSRIETGSFRPSLGLIERICAELHIEEETLMFGGDIASTEAQQIAKKLDCLDKNKLKAVSMIIDLIS